MTVEEIVADAEAAYVNGVWPAHPEDEPVTHDDALSLYLGTAGMLWALRRLGSTLEVEIGELEEPSASYLAGEVGHLAVTRANDARLQELIVGHARSPAWEVLYGSPGTILAAKHTGLEWRRSAEILVDEWDRAPDGLWTQRIAEREFKFLGPAHGFAGNVHALRGFLDDDELRRRIEPVLREYAIWDGDTVNWPPIVGHEPSRVQWCHGAPGFVIALGDLLPEDLLLAAAEKTWRTGPLEKGHGLCHGTAGNGYALLKMHELTGDELWLERARHFSDAALAQCQQRYSLFTGDIGAALFARACDEADARFPTIDFL